MRASQSIPTGAPDLKLTADKLVLTRGARTIIDGLSFEVQAGEALLLTGPNGAGKTTLLRALAGFLRPAGGMIGLEGGDPEREISEQCHCVGHLNGVKSSLTVSENLTFWAEYLNPTEPGGSAARVQAALERLRLCELTDIPAGYLSAGQRRRLGLARLLLADRPVWLLDEPTVSLDTASSELLAAVVNDHLGRAGLVVAATHQPLALTRARELRLGFAAGAA